MTTAAIDAPATDVFDLDVRVETRRVETEAAACQTDDGCGHTCELSACHSQR
ncbi:FxLD family lanthipeptide [Saccharothrix violaceirubra]|uniref:FxLD family lantipeptide n=1 Tax=Saccharothrix violaceirubra TaxID=413306 RepID=A0A7W7SZ19_9PSEU|nr:FxLD family lanthipeptide [Saccharothrix violaceirubra]MBB4963494.1 FxLD family lantipeptide [Saccharothrix violaceirubra]